MTLLRFDGLTRGTLIIEELGENNVGSIMPLSFIGIHYEFWLF
jgi:hypothetical protein